MGGKSAGDLEAFAVANAETAGGLLGEVEQIHGSQDALKVCSIHPRSLCRATEHATDADVILHAEPWKHTDQLKRPADPQTADLIAATAVMSVPRKRIRPVVGRTNPVRTLNRLVLPAPFGPMSATISPRCKAKLTAESATSPPKRTESRSTSSSKGIEGAIGQFLTRWPPYPGDMKAVILEVFGVLVNDLHGQAQ